MPDGWTQGALLVPDTDGVLLDSDDDGDDLSRLPLRACAAAVASGVVTNNSAASSSSIPYSFDSLGK